MTTLTSPHDLLAAIPFLVGFKPEDSIVLLTLKDDSIAMAMRIDFPETLDSEQVEVIMDHLQSNESQAVIAVYYIPETSTASSEVIKSIRVTWFKRLFKSPDKSPDSSIKSPI